MEYVKTRSTGTGSATSQKSGIRNVYTREGKRHGRPGVRAKNRNSRHKLLNGCSPRGVGGDNGGDHLIADGKLELGDQMVEADLHHLADQLSPPAYGSSLFFRTSFPAPSAINTASSGKKRYHCIDSGVTCECVKNVISRRLLSKTISRSFAGGRNRMPFTFPKCSSSTRGIKSASSDPIRIELSSSIRQ